MLCFNVILYFWQHFWHLKFGPGLRWPFMFEKQWWISLLLRWQNIELLPTPFLHTQPGYLLGLTWRSIRGLLISILVLDILTRSLFASKLSFQAQNWFSNPSKDWSIITRSSAYSSCHGHPRWQLTTAKSKGLRIESWWTPSLTPNFSLKVLFLKTLNAASVYIAWTNLTFRSLIPNFCVAHQMTFLATLLKAFLRFTKAK